MHTMHGHGLSQPRTRLPTLRLVADSADVKRRRGQHFLIDLQHQSM
jgi:hypothetical protein